MSTQQCLFTKEKCKVNKDSLNQDADISTEQWTTTSQIRASKMEDK